MSGAIIAAIAAVLIAIFAFMQPNAALKERLEQANFAAANKAERDEISEIFFKYFLNTDYVPDNYSLHAHYSNSRLILARVSAQLERVSHPNAAKRPIYKLIIAGPDAKNFEKFGEFLPDLNAVVSSTSLKTVILSEEFSALFMR